MEVKLADVPGIAVPDLGTTLGYVKNDKKIVKLFTLKLETEILRGQDN